jgi:hypothetical protein
MENKMSQSSGDLFSGAVKPTDKEIYDRLRVLNFDTPVQLRFWLQKWGMTSKECLAAFKRQSLRYSYRAINEALLWGLFGYTVGFIISYPSRLNVLAFVAGLGVAFLINTGIHYFLLRRWRNEGSPKV